MCRKVTEVVSYRMKARLLEHQKLPALQKVRGDKDTRVRRVVSLSAQTHIYIHTIEAHTH